MKLDTLGILKDHVTAMIEQIDQETEDHYEDPDGEEKTKALFWLDGKAQACEEVLRVLDTMKTVIDGEKR